MTHPKQKPDLAFEELEGLDEVVVIDHETGNCVSLNITAAAVLELCDGTRDIGEISSVLAESFTIPVTNVREDIDRLLKQLRELNLLLP